MRWSGRAVLQVTLVALFASVYGIAGVSAAAGVAGTIRTAFGDSTAVSGLDVNLYELRGGSANLKEVVATDANGRYSFGNLMADPGITYGMQVVYSGVPQGSELFSLQHDGVTTIDLAVFDTTSSPRYISLERVHVILHPQAEKLGVTAMYIVSNGGPIFVGDSLTADGRSRTVRFLLPPGHTDFAVLQGAVGAPAHHVKEDWGFASLLPQYPGKDTVVFHYALPWQGRTTFEQVSPYPVASLNVVGRIGVVDLDVEGGETDPSQEMPDLLNIHRAWIPASTPVRISVMAVGSAAAEQESGIATFLIVLVAFIAGIAALAVYVLHRDRRRAKPADVATPRNGPAASQKMPDTVDDLAAAIDELDEEFEADRVAASEYVAQRRAMKRRLVELLHGE